MTEHRIVDINSIKLNTILQKYISFIFQLMEIGDSGETGPNVRQLVLEECRIELEHVLIPFLNMVDSIVQILMQRPCQGMG